jgi:hypothetical protein
VGALFAPEAYQFFPYFAVAYTSALVETLAQKQSAPEGFIGRGWRRSYGVVRASNRRANDFTPVQ